jgi:hypothetical protein
MSTGINGGGATITAVSDGVSGGSTGGGGTGGTGGSGGTKGHPPFVGSGQVFGDTDVPTNPTVIQSGKCYFVIDSYTGKKMTDCLPSRIAAQEKAFNMATKTNKTMNI